MATHTATAPNTTPGASTGVTVMPGCTTPMTCPKPHAARKPNTMPNTPPATHSMTASSRNCFVMSRRRAPSDLRRPISRMRSVTFVSIMFMMPMPPTNSEMDATDPMSSENDIIIVSICLMTASSDCT